MRYMKAADVLPPDLLKQIQTYIDGEYLYIPRRAETRSAWGAAKAARRKPWPEIWKSIGAIGRGRLLRGWLRSTF